MSLLIFKSCHKTSDRREENRRENKATTDERKKKVTVGQDARDTDGVCLCVNACTYVCVFFCVFVCTCD